jgi:beta-1,4-mannosyl-glycoprotein beta-1,4-N-acetylglucosaminyltransferase
MIIDSFIFFNEYDILEGRLEYLYDTVDYFVLVESNLAFVGNPKPMNFMKNMSRYKKYLDKIIYSPYLANEEQFPFIKLPVEARNFDNNFWKIETAQRNHITYSLRLFNDTDYIIISDVDEIPSKLGIELAVGNTEANKELLSGVPIIFEQILFYHNFNLLHRPDWPGSCISTVEHVLKNSPQYYRNNRWNAPRITGGGHHLSYWGSAENTSTKLKNFSHQELNTPDFTDVEIIKNKINLGIDILGRTDYYKTDLNSIDPEIINIFDKFAFKSDQ